MLLPKLDAGGSNPLSRSIVSKRFRALLEFLGSKTALLTEPIGAAQL